MTPFQQVPSLSGPISTLTAIDEGSQPTGSITWQYFMHGDSSYGDQRFYCSTGTDFGGTTLTGPLTCTYNGVSATYLSGDQQTTGTEAWRTATCDLSALPSGAGKPVWLYSRSGSGWKGDFNLHAMSITIGGSTTNLAPSTGSTGYKFSPKADYSSVASCESAWENDTLGTFETVDTGADDWEFINSKAGSSCSANGTGPCNSIVNSVYMVYVETSSSKFNDRFSFLTTNNSYTLPS